MFHSALFRITGRAAVAVLVLSLILSGLCLAQTAPAAKSDVTGFFRGITGEWVGTCVQSTNGEKAEDKYFHVIINEVAPGTFDSRFECFRYDDESGNPLKIGEATIMTKVALDGSAECKINGKGVVLVNDQPKNQEHEVLESLNSAASGGLQGKGIGKISVFGMPLGLGKNGKVEESRSTWTVNDGVLTINQKISVGFRALFITKKFDVEARYVAHRGSDLASLMTDMTQASAKPAGKF
ncbi:MAG: hypothetical protein ACYC64_14445 [Armatimonadota bacterium]